MLATGSLCLFFDLGRPVTIAALFFSERVNYMTVGAWSLVALIVITAVLLVFAANAPQNFSGSAKANGRWSMNDARATVTRIRLVLYVAGVALSMYMAVYTGLLLRLAYGVDLWSTDMLPVLFAVSALASGFAVFSLCCRGYDLHGIEATRFHRRAALTDLVLLAVELLAAGAYLLALRAAPFGMQALSVLFAGESMALFVGGFCGIGIAAPLVADAVALRTRSGETSLAVAAAASLVGAFCLRFALVQAGVNVLF